MAKDFLEVIDSINAEQASTRKLFEGEGSRVRPSEDVKLQEAYQNKLVDAGKLIVGLFSGKRSALWKFQEAMTTSDFPLLFGDILDRILLGNYQETPQVYRNFCKISSVTDFRNVKRFHTDGAESTLDFVQQQEEYPESKLTEGKYEYAVKKYGRRMPFAWETMINDDLNALKDVPARFGRAARRTESKFATQLYTDANGPHASFYTAPNGNIVTGNPALDVNAIQAGLTVLSKQTDEDGEPIFIDMVNLVVPPALEWAARNILNSAELRINENGGSTNTQMIVNNWMKNRMQLSVEPYIPHVASSANGDTSWWLFASPNEGRPALEMGFLAGHLSPEIYYKAPNATRIGGGSADFMGGDFDTDSINYKVRHVLGGTQMDPKMTVASNGSGS